MTERADTFIAAQFQDEIDSRIVEALVRVLDIGDGQANELCRALLNTPRFKEGFQRALGTVGINTYHHW